MPVKIVCEPLSDTGKAITEILPTERHPSHVGLTITEGQVIFKGKDTIFGIPSGLYRWSIQSVSQKDVLEASGSTKRVGHAMVDRTEAEFISSLMAMYATDMKPACLSSFPADVLAQLSDGDKTEALAMSRQVEMAERLKRTFDRVVERLPKHDGEAEEAEA